MENCRVLFVDDESDFLETLVKRMKKRQIDVRGVNSGEDAIGWLQQNTADVVVLDVKMPGMDGIETLRQIRALDPLVEVIMLTGHASLEAAKAGMELGAFDYLMKPVDIDELLYKVQDAYTKKAIHEKKIQTIKEVINST